MARSFCLSNIFSVLVEISFFALSFDLSKWAETRYQSFETNCSHLIYMYCKCTGNTILVLFSTLIPRCLKYKVKVWLLCLSVIKIAWSKERNVKHRYVLTIEMTYLCNCILEFKMHFYWSKYPCTLRVKTMQHQ